MKFSLLDPTSKKLLVFPVTPNKLTVGMETKTISYSHVMLGDTEIPRGINPIRIQFGGILPVNEISVPTESDEKADDVIKQIREWQGEDRKKLQLIITDTPWNLDVFISAFEPDYEGPLVNFSISLVEQPKSMTVQVNKKKKKKRPTPKPKKKKTRTYTVKSGDNLWNIAKKYTGKGIRWKEMWKINKSKSRSGNPHLIYPGESYQIPSDW